MPSRCAAYKCPNKPRHKQKPGNARIFYYSLEIIEQRNPDRFDAFLETIGYGYTSNLESLKHHVICSDHFTEDAYQPFELSRLANSTPQLNVPTRAPKLKHDAWPTLNLVKVPKGGTPSGKRRKVCQQSRNVQQYSSQVPDPHSPLVHKSYAEVKHKPQAECTAFVAFEHIKLELEDSISGYTECVQENVPSQQCDIKLEPLEGGSQELCDTEETIPSMEHHIKSELDGMEHIPSQQLENLEDGSQDVCDMEEMILSTEHQIKSESLEEMEPCHSIDLNRMEHIPSQRSEPLEDGILSQQFTTLENGISSQLLNKRENIKKVGYKIPSHCIKSEPTVQSIPSQQFPNLENRISSQLPNKSENVKKVEFEIQSHCIKSEPIPSHQIEDRLQLTDTEFLDISNVCEDGIPAQQFTNLEDGISSQLINRREDVKKVGFEIPYHCIKSEPIQIEDRCQLTDMEFLDVSNLSEDGIPAQQFTNLEDGISLQLINRREDVKKVGFEIPYHCIKSEPIQIEDRCQLTDMEFLDVSNLSEDGIPAQQFTNLEDEISSQLINKREDVKKVGFEIPYHCIKSEPIQIEDGNQLTNMEFLDVSKVPESVPEQNESKSEIDPLQTDFQKSYKNNNKSEQSCSETEQAEDEENQETRINYDDHTYSKSAKEISIQHQQHAGTYMCLICHRTEDKTSLHKFDDFCAHLDTHIDSSFKTCVCSTKCTSINDYYMHLKANRCVNDINFSGFVWNHVPIECDTSWLRCKRCTTTVTNYCNYVIHELYSHMSAANDIKLSILLMATYYRCPECNCTFKDQNLFYAHCNSPILFPETINYCTKCLLSFQSERAFSSHMKTKDHVLECQLCRKVTDDVQSLIRHKTMEHNVRMVYCTGCFDTVTLDDFTSMHLYVCFKVEFEQRFCTLCGFKCLTFGELIMHMKIDLLTVKYCHQCRLCYNYFWSKFNLSCHLIQCSGLHWSEKIEAAPHQISHQVSLKQPEVIDNSKQPEVIHKFKVIIPRY